MRKVIQPEFLNDHEWSPLWEEYLRDALPFDPLKADEISVIVPIPNSKGVLIFDEGGVYRSERNGLEVLGQISRTHGFPDYRIMSACLKSLKCFGQYKFPWVCPYFVLCPLESATQTIWINPSSIYCLKMKDGLCTVELLSGPKLLLPIQRKAFLKRTEIACGVLAVIRRDLFRFMVKSNAPGDYISGETPFFKHLIRTRSLLQQFPIQAGTFLQQYEKANFMHHYKKLKDDPKNSDWHQWL